MLSSVSNSNGKFTGPPHQIVEAVFMLDLLHIEFGDFHQSWIVDQRLKRLTLKWATLESGLYQFRHRILRLNGPPFVNCPSIWKNQIDPAVDRPGQRLRSASVSRCHTKTNWRRPAARPRWDFQCFRSQGVGPSSGLVQMEGKVSWHLTYSQTYTDMIWVPRKKGNPEIHLKLKYDSCPSGLVSNVDQHWRKASCNASQKQPANLLAWPLFDVKEGDLCFPK